MSSFARPSLAAILAACGHAPTRVLCTGGVVWVAAGAGRWRAASDDRSSWDATSGAGGAGGGAEGGAIRPALAIEAVDRWLAAHAVRPVALALPDGPPRGATEPRRMPDRERAGMPHGERLVLLSAAGALGWRPPLEELGTRGAAGTSGQLHRAALRLRPLIDAAEQHALDAACRYAVAAAGAARVARLLDASALETVGVTPGLFVAVDALAGAGLRTLVAAELLAARAFGRGLLGAPPTLRATLLEVRAVHAAPAATRRRALRRQAAAGLGPPAVRVRRLGVGGGATWAVRVPVGRAATAAVADAWMAGALAPGVPASRTTDAFEAAWSLATEAWRALTLVAYATADAWAFD